MGKKGKSGKSKKSGNKKKSGKKKAGEQQMTIGEAILAYQINIKEKAIEDFMYEIKGLEDKRDRNQERRDLLQEDQMHHIKTFLKRAKKREKELENTVEIGKDQVEAAMFEKWAVGREEETFLKELKEEIEAKEEELKEMIKEVAKWTAYRNEGRHKHSKAIAHLEQEMIDIDISFDEMKGHLRRSNVMATEEITIKTDERLNEQKHLASEQAMKTLDKYSGQEVMDNDWLKKEAELHRKETGTIQRIVEQLELENLELMSELFECRIEDLKVSRNFFLTQIQEGDQLEPGILEVDLNQLQTKKDDQLFSEFKSSMSSSVKSVRPRSATQKAVEDKVFGLKVQEEWDTDESNSESEEDDASETTDTRLKLLNENYLNYEDEELDEYLKLGPVELKMLSVSGKKIPIHTLSGDHETIDLKVAPPVWPVTQSMLRSISSQGK